MPSNMKQSTKEKQSQGRKIYSMSTTVSVGRKGEDVTYQSQVGNQSICMGDVASNSSSLDIPQPMDIILGRGKAKSKNPGNLIFQEFVHSNRQRYCESSFPVKRAIIDEVLQLIKSIGGRFVTQKDNNVWSIIPAKTCRLKIAHAIQYHIRNESQRGKSKVVSSNKTKDAILLASFEHEKPRSDHERFIMDLEAQISLLRTQSSISDLTTPFKSNGSDKQTYHSNHYQNAMLLHLGDTGAHIKEEVQPSNPDAYGYPFLEQSSVAPSFMSRYDDTKNNQRPDIHSMWTTTTDKCFQAKIPDLPMYEHLRQLNSKTPRSQPEEYMNQIPGSTPYIIVPRDFLYFPHESMFLSDRNESSSTTTQHHRCENQSDERRAHKNHMENYISTLEHMSRIQALHDGHHCRRDLDHYGPGMEEALPPLQSSSSGGIDIHQYHRPMVMGGWHMSPLDLSDDQKVAYVPSFDDEGDLECASLALSNDGTLEE